MEMTGIFTNSIPNSAPQHFLLMASAGISSRLCSFVTELRGSQRGSLYIMRRGEHVGFLKMPREQFRVMCEILLMKSLE